MRDRAESIRRLTRSFTEIPFQQLRDAMEGKIGPADGPVQEFEGHPVGRGSGMELDLHHFQLWRFDGDRVVEFRIEPSRDAAVALARGREHPG